MVAAFATLQMAACRSSRTLQRKPAAALKPQSKRQQNPGGTPPLRGPRLAPPRPEAAIKARPCALYQTLAIGQPLSAYHSLRNVLA